MGGKEVGKLIQLIIEEYGTTLVRKFKPVQVTFWLRASEGCLGIYMR